MRCSPDEKHNIQETLRYLAGSLDFSLFTHAVIGETVLKLGIFECVPFARSESFVLGVHSGMKKPCEK